MNKIKSLIIFIFVLYLSGCGSSNDYVLSIDGEKISATEYNVYLDEQVKSFEEQGGTDIWEIDFDGVPAKSVAKQNAVNTIVMVKAAVDHAEQLGVVLTEDEKAQAAKRASEIEGDNPELITEIMEESAIQSKVYDKITGSYQVNNEEFEAYLADYYQQNKYLYSKYTAKEIFIQSTDSRYSYEDIQKRYNNMTGSADFDAFAKEVSPDTQIIPQVLDTSLYSEEVSAQLANAKKDDIIFSEDTTGYHIFQITDISVDPVVSIRDEVKEKYIYEKKQEIYNTQNDSWTSAMNVEKNMAVYDAIDIDVNK